MIFSQIDPDTQSLILHHLVTVYGLSVDNQMDLRSSLDNVQIIDSIIPKTVSDIYCMNLHTSLDTFLPIIIYIEGIKNGYMKFWHNKLKNNFVFSIGITHGSIKSEIIHIISSDELMIEQINNETWKQFINHIYHFLHIIETTDYSIILGLTSFSSNITYKFVFRIISQMSNLFHDKIIDKVIFSNHYCLPYSNSDASETILSGYIGSFYLTYNYQNSDFSVQKIYYNSSNLIC